MVCLSTAAMVDAAAAEKFLDANPQFAKQYYDNNLRPKCISDLLESNRKPVLDISKFHDLTMVDESEILFDMMRDMQDNLLMEKSVFKLMKHLSFIMRADRMSLFMYRQRNGVAELATRLALHQAIVTQLVMFSRRHYVKNMYFSCIRISWKMKHCSLRENFLHLESKKMHK